MIGRARPREASRVGVGPAGECGAELRPHCGLPAAVLSASLAAETLCPEFHLLLPVLE